ncbi:EAL domain-containing protein [Pseudoduganella violacea]|uniref:Diguanylate cyclase (GGDEF)-like protein n=1 Tax=Pseudoduganella violacea TaxID=1715466 RepID=A0A7W5FWC6_9BURK|nr:EAL domain-containing protein [Pseudoduganella violacea]MBB3121717.1 diguanylate cyclase (GGDEF)-like protein [Pseudoduganella violacea]
MTSQALPQPLVLVVDDDAMTRILVTEALEPEGFRLAEAVSGEEAITSFQYGAPDLILLDVTMPGMSGFECCEQLRRLPGGAHVPIVVLTSNDDDASIGQALAAGASDFIAKPMQWRLLAHRMRYLLRASRALAELTRVQESLSHAQALARLGNWEYRIDTGAGYWSPQLLRILGVAPDTSPASFDRLLACLPEDQRPQLLDAFMGLHAGAGSYGLEHRVLQPDGETRIVFHQAEAVYESGRLALIRGTVQDITERKQQELRIEYLANHDALTGLPNRNLLHDRISQAIARTRRTGLHLATLVLDLDRFKFVNDSYGHPVGDALLQAVSSRLKMAVREGDTVARLGGDEFVVLLADLVDTRTAEDVVQKVLSMFIEPFLLGEHSLHISTSIGVSEFPADGDTGEILLKTADAALYSAKDKGRNCYQFYHPKMGVLMEERADIEHALHQALARGELELHYQPKVDLNGGQIYGMEALLRWRRPDIGQVPPDRFIPLAEETGLIIPIGEWVLRTACAQLHAWHGGGFPHLTMAVNVSARQFRQMNMPDLVRAVLADSGVPAQCLELELTESLLMQNQELVVRDLKQLKEIGVTLSLDDFGTGYSSLSYLKQFPIDVVKIDQSFIRDVTDSVDGASLTKSIIAMAKSLNMTTIAEGVETQGQLGFLNTHRCDAIQGYYFSRPLAGSEMGMLLQAGTQLPPDSCHAEPRQRVLLLVDDEQNVLSALQRALRGEGYRILCAGTGQEALELLAIHPVGVIVSDARMPEMAGTELLRRVKGLHPEIVRIMLSGYTELSSVTEAINEGAVYKFITKPWDDSLLREHIRESFRLHEAGPQRLDAGHDGAPRVAMADGAA